MKKNIIVIYGGKSVEHDISIITGLQVVHNASNEYNIIPIYIDRQGKWYTGKKFIDINIYADFKSNNKVQKTEVVILPSSNFLYKKSGKAFKQYIKIDCVILAMHGLNGEDGTLQGLLELSGIPYTSSGTLGASCAMDKIVMKMLFSACGLNILPYTWILREEFNVNSEKVLLDIENKLNYPIIVKPSNLGSSIGITISNNRTELKHSIDIACYYDSRIILEKALTNFKEINCSALGTSDNVMVSECEEPVNWHKFLSFEDKYIKGNGKNKGMHNLARILPANITQEIKILIQNYTCTVFKTFECKGVVRVDYLIDNTTNAVYINEINTIPGSFAFYLWEESKIKFSKLITTLIEIADNAYKQKNKNEYAYNSEVLKKFAVKSK
ncbi:MAG: D-alanine--D-alanine ligase family protein [Clostridia bacterium]|jgi:D-alanine-D-alanine ligase|nr:D-alanine--D-alanine ligase [Clostridia bacterium]